jgi:hypothetical protein
METQKMNKDGKFGLQFYYLQNKLVTNQGENFEDNKK